MRVTQSMLANNMMRNLSQSYERLSSFQNQLSTNKKINRPSDDPVIAMKGMNYRTDLTEIQQFKRNLSEAYNWLENTDSAFDKTTAAMQRVRDLVVQASNDTFETTQRQLIGNEIKELTDHIESIANTKISNKYIFNGSSTTKRPVNLSGIDVPVSSMNESPANFVVSYKGKEFEYSGDGFTFLSGSDTIVFENLGQTPTATFNGEDVSLGEIIVSQRDAIPLNNNEVKIELSKGVNIVVNSLPRNTFSSELFTDLKKLLNDLNNPATDGKKLSGMLEKVDKHLLNITSERSEMGARFNRVELIEDRLTTQEIVANRMISDNEDIDIERVITDLKTQESIHRAALSVGAKIIQPTLMDFLR